MFIIFSQKLYFVKHSDPKTVHTHCILSGLSNIAPPKPLYSKYFLSCRFPKYILYAGLLVGCPTLVKCLKHLIVNTTVLTICENV